MGNKRRLFIAPNPRRRWAIDPTTGLRRRTPRSYLEWKTLAGWARLPPWEEDPPGYLLRRLRERQGCSQRDLAERLGCTQQAVAQAERWESNPTVRFVRAWARALGSELALGFHDRRRAERSRPTTGAASPGRGQPPG